MTGAESKHDSWEDATAEDSVESPHHGFQGDRAPSPAVEAVPASLTIAISREAGSRGSSIATRAGAKLGWQVFNQELLEYIAQEGNFRQDLVANRSPAAAHWAEVQLQRLLKEQNLSQHPSLIDLARIILALGSQGEAVLVGRGAGFLLPARTTLHARIVAPLADRIAYMSQWLRLTPEAAADQVRLRDSRRGEFITTHFHRQASDVHQYDLVLNSSLLGEEACAELIAQAARAKLEMLSDVDE